MIHSIDLRYRVVDFVRSGGSQSEAARRFQVSRWCVWNWLKRENLEPKKVKTRNRKLNKSIVIQHVTENPDAALHDYAEFFGVSMAAISKAFKRFGIRKKNDEIRGTQVYTTD